MLGLRRGPKPKELINTKWSANLAYAIGLLTTDGCLAKSATLIDLTSKDREQLNNFNHCIGLKSKTLGEIKIPDKYFYDFLRGCFDGDGCFYSYRDKRWKSSFMFYTEFASASPTFIEWIRNKNKEFLSINGHISKSKMKSTQQLKYAKRESLLLLERMYHCQDLVCLSRKRLKIAKVFDSIGLSVRHLSYT